MNRTELLKPVVGILRGIDPGFFPELMAASFAAGLSAIEVTVNTAGAFGMVSTTRPRVPEGCLLGMGTIRNPDEGRAAIEAGAMFLVTPNLDPAVIELARKQKLPIIAGAFTPSEVYRAWAAGADLVKVFPCGGLGPGYIRELRGPFDHIPMVAVGGVKEENVAEYLAAGAVGVGVGTSLFGREAIAARDPRAIEKNVAEFLARAGVGKG